MCIRPRQPKASFTHRFQPSPASSHSLWLSLSSYHKLGTAMCIKANRQPANHRCLKVTTSRMNDLTACLVAKPRFASLPSPPSHHKAILGNNRCQVKRPAIQPVLAMNGMRRSSQCDNRQLDKHLHKVGKVRCHGSSQ